MRPPIIIPLADPQLYKKPNRLQDKLSFLQESQETELLLLILMSE